MGQSGLPILFLHLKNTPKLENLFPNIVPNVLCLVVQSCPTLCDSMDCGPPGSSFHRDSPRKEYWNGFPYPPLRDLPDPGIKPASVESPALAGRFFTAEPPGKHEALV